MKIKQGHYVELKDRVSQIHTTDRQNEYKSRGLSDMRYRWDCLHASQSNVLLNELYKYLNDNNIDTALKSIITELNKSNS